MVCCFNLFRLTTLTTDKYAYSASDDIVKKYDREFYLIDLTYQYSAILYITTSFILIHYSINIAILIFIIRGIDSL